MDYERPLMSKTVKTPVVALVAFCLAALLALAGCASPSTEGAEEQAANRDYMSQVNLVMDDLNAGLENFSEAVSRSDIVGMRTQAENAYKAIDELNKITVPDGLSDIQDEYVKGCTDLKDALNGYIDLYANIDTATEEQPFDYDSYDSELDKIKDKYNDGIEHLENADKKATEME